MQAHDAVLPASHDSAEKKTFAEPRFFFSRNHQTTLSFRTKRTFAFLYHHPPSQSRAQYEAAMNAVLSSVRSRALEAVSSLSSSRSSLPTSSSTWRTDKPRPSWNRPSLFKRDADTIRSEGATTPSRSTLLFIAGCLAWYTSSSLSSNTSKALLSKSRADSTPPAFPYPVTLTLVHFAFVNVCCAICASRRILGERTLTRLVKPSLSRVAEVGQLAFFNVLGQALSSLAISRVPVATVHTIKALSPLFTVLSYTWLFNVTYSRKTYASLVPLTMGVMMACTGFAFNADDVVGFCRGAGEHVCVCGAKHLLEEAAAQGREERRRHPRHG